MVLDLIFFTLIVILATTVVVSGIYKAFILPRVRRETQEMVTGAITDLMSTHFAEEWKQEFGELVTQRITDALVERFRDDLHSRN